ncbi:MAG: threonine ammonia-lyase [Pyrinomonadaceae bacterium]
MTVKFSDIEDARSVLEGVIANTPVLPDNALSAKIGIPAYSKAECLQRSGSFKIRGAYNKISRLTPGEKERGVIAASAGNHAQGVALAAALHNISSTIVVPKYAPLTKVNATRNYGADVILEGAGFDEAVAYSRKLQEERNLTYVHAFEDEKVIAGQGTIGIEIARDLPDATVVVVPIGGGGIISGTAIAIKTLLPKARVIGVEAKNLAVINESLRAGQPVEMPFKSTIADGIAIKRPGSISLELIKEYVDEVVEVTEEEIAYGIFHCVQNNHLVVEGAGAAGVAAVLANKIDLGKNDVVCSVLCGGNIDANLLARILEQVLVREGRYIIVKSLVDDRPGGLAQMLKKVAEIGANVIEVFHRRALWLAPFGRVGVEMLLEVKDEEHGKEVIAYLEESGYQIQREEQGGWE